jgi:hypothetical protein
MTLTSTSRLAPEPLPAAVMKTVEGWLAERDWIAGT